MQWIQSADRGPELDAGIRDVPVACRASPQMLDIGNSAAVQQARCTTEAPPAEREPHQPGPRQAYVMAMPRGTSETAITYEEAYFVFGFRPRRCSRR